MAVACAVRKNPKEKCDPIILYYIYNTKNNNKTKNTFNKTKNFPGQAANSHSNNTGTQDATIPTEALSSYPPEKISETTLEVLSRPVCPVCHKPVRKGRTYCCRSCYLDAHMSEVECPICLETYMKKRKEQMYCSKECAGKALLRAKKRCPVCQKQFIGRATYCSRECKSASQRKDFTPRRLTLVDAEAPSKSRRNWRMVPVAEWTLAHFWYWLSESLASVGQDIERDLTKSDWCKLRNFQEKYDHGDGERGVSIPTLHDTCVSLVQDYAVYRDRFQWIKPFSPGTLIGYWASIVAMQHGCGDAGRLQRWSGGPQTWDSVSTSGGSCVAQSWDDLSSQAVVKPTGRIRKTEWKFLPQDKWSVTTIWAYLYDNLRAKGVKVQALTTTGRKKLNVLVARESVDAVRLVSKEFVQDYHGMIETLTWDGPFRPSVFVGFWKGIKAKVLAKVPFLLGG